ncbi:MAG: hypothetical protein PHU85_17605, partial [Phycisphaerae bacterium]|nr:hypothetical protein [Phycisphaerae bacterium]
MYFQRLKIFLGLIGIVLVVWIARLALLQIVRGDDYLQQARDSLINPVKTLPTERGRIVDRYNVLLARDEPSFGVAIEYGVLSGNAQYLAGGSYTRRMSRARAEELAPAARERYETLIDRVGEVCGLSREELNERREKILRDVGNIKAKVSLRMGRPTAIPDEFMAHTVIENISPDARDKLLGMISQHPGLQIVATQRRFYPIGECVAHLVGTEGPVGPEDIEAAPFAADARQRYLPGDRKGISGVEWMAERRLRGYRGYSQTDRDGKVLKDTPAVRGGAVRLTIDAELQKQVYEALGRYVAKSPYPCGGSVVVINVNERTVAGHTIRAGEVLALVSYPSFDPNLWRELYPQLNADARGRPMLFRAV